MFSPIGVLLALSAHALVPTDQTLQGVEPGRVLVTHPDEQGRLLQDPRWRAFVRDDAPGWTARFDEATGRPRWAWGGGIALPADREAMVEALIALLDRHAELFGLDPGSLRVRSVEEDRANATTYVEFDTLRAGLPTFRGGISARLLRGRLVLLEVRTDPLAPVAGALRIPRSGAVKAAIALGPAPHAIHAGIAAEPVLLERITDGSRELRQTWLVTSRTKDPPGDWVTFVDGETGALLNVHNRVLFATGTVTGLTHPRTVDGSPLVASAMPLVEVQGATDAATADETGVFTVGGPGPYVTDLHGAYAQVINHGAPDAELRKNDASRLEWTTSDADQAEIDTYRFVHDVRAWGRQYAPDVPWVQGPIRATVNERGTCNAYWDGELHFFDAGGGCNDTGEIADIVYHEWGHGLHFYSVLGGTFDTTVSEAAGDFLSVLLTDDAVVAPYFETGGGPVRDLEPDRVYPGDVVGEMHTDGLILGGALVDLLRSLQQDLGAEAGTALTSDRFARMLKGGPTLTDAYHELRVADDDDADLENGTPHVCRIHEAFALHGLSDGAEGVTTSHAPLTVEPAGVPHPVRVELVDVSAGCRPAEADAGEVHYRVAGGAWSTAPLAAAPGGVLAGEIPPLGEGALVEYYLTGTTLGGESFVTPSGGAANPHTFYEGELLEVSCEDFEQGDGGYTHALLAGPPGPGADDWQWGTPVGRAGDPGGAFDGVHAWGNDLGAAGYDGAYQADRHTRLASPPIDTGWYTGVLLRYRRWLTVEDGRYDEARILANGQEVWRNPAGGGEDHTLDGSWRHHVVDLGGAADRSSVTLAWELRSDPALELGGWTLDDVCLLAPATADNRLGIGDLRVEATGPATVRLSWTQPRHGPVEEVRVVRRAGALPAGPEDGVIVAELWSPTPGAPAELEDTSPDPGANGYAVYGFDGLEWLSWTIDGLNAATLDLGS